MWSFKPPHWWLFSPYALGPLAAWKVYDIILWAIHHTYFF